MNLDQALKMTRQLLTDEGLAGIMEVKVGVDAEGLYVTPVSGFPGASQDGPTLRSEQDVERFYGQLAAEDEKVEASRELLPDPGDGKDAERFFRRDEADFLGI